MADWQSLDPEAAREAEKYENPIPSREYILDLLDSADQPVTHEQMCVMLKLTDEDQVEALRRRLIAMARDGLFFPAAAVIHPRFNTPARCIALQAVLASILGLSGTFEQIVSYFFFVVLLFLGLTVFGLFLLRRRDRDRFGYLTPGYPFTPIVFLILLAMMLFLLAAGQPKQSFLGCAVVLAGVPVYYLFFKRASA